MTDSKRVTPEELAVTLSAFAHSIFDALPEPPPSADVDAGWEGHDRGHLRLAQVPAFLRSVIASGERIHKADVDDIEAAIRAEAGTLDVERLARAVLDTPAAFPGSDLCRYCENIDGHAFDCVVVIARKYARLTEADR